MLPSHAPIIVDLNKGEQETDRLDLDAALAPLLLSRRSLSSMAVARTRVQGRLSPELPRSPLLHSFWPSRATLLAPPTPLQARSSLVHAHR
jgi:hypothetical protein